MNAIHNHIKSPIDESYDDESNAYSHVYDSTEFVSLSHNGYSCVQHVYPNNTGHHVQSGTPAFFLSFVADNFSDLSKRRWDNAEGEYRDSQGECGSNVVVSDARAITAQFFSVTSKYVPDVVTIGIQQCS